MRKIPCVFMRGGACKGGLFHLKDLPRDRKKWDKIFLKVMGSPDPKQVDGLGGGTSSNNKILIINPAQREDADIDYTVAQVIPDRPQVDYKSNCGNMTTAVAPFAIDEGLVEAKEPYTYVKLFNTNTGKNVETTVPVKNGRTVTCGDYKFAGVLGTSAELPLTFKNPAGTLNGKLFPTGHHIDVLEIPDYGTIEATILDAAGPLIIVRATDIGLTGTELPMELDGKADMMSLLKTIRGVGSKELGLVDRWQDAETLTPATPKIALFAKAQNYTSISGEIVKREEMDICSRIISVNKTHNAYVFTGAIAMGVAAMYRGTIINSSLKLNVNNLIRLGHPSGIMPVGLQVKNTGEKFEVEGVTLTSTARRIMDGFVYVD